MSIEQATEVLKETVFRDKKCISYRLLSRKLHIHVNEAKKLLQQFYDANSESLSASFVLMGIENVVNIGGNDQDEDVNMTADDDNKVELEETGRAVYSPLTERVRVAVFDSKDLGEARAHFKSITSESIYSVSMSRANDVTLLSGDAREVQMIDWSEALANAFEIYGLIKNPILASDVETLIRSSKLPIDTPARNATKPSVAAKPSIEKPSTEATASAKTAHQTAGATASKAPLKTAPNVFDRFKVKPGDTKSNDAKTSKPQKTNSLLSAFSKVGRPKEPKEKVVMEEVVEVAESKSESQPEPEEPLDIEARKRELEEQKKKREKLQRIFSDDEDVINEKSGSSHKPSAVQEVLPDANSSKQPIEVDTVQDPKAPEDGGGVPDSPDWDYDAIMEDGTEDLVDKPAKGDSDPEPSKESTQVPLNKARPRRKVSKRISSVDESGYLVTEYKDVWESYSEEEDETSGQEAHNSTAKAKPLNIPEIPSRAGKDRNRDNKKGQASLMSFFGGK